MHYFENSQAQLFAELERIDLLIRAQVGRMRKNAAEDEQFRGLYLSERDVDALLEQPLGRPHWFPAEDQASVRLEALAQENGLRRDASRARGIDLRLDRLQQLFELERFELDALLICLAGELDLRYERLYAYLQDDVTRKKPSVDLVLNLLTRSLVDKLDKRQRFLPTAPLIRHDLLVMSSDPSCPDPPLLGQSLTVDPRVRDFLLAWDELDPRIRFCAAVVAPESDAPYFTAEGDTAAQLSCFIASRKPGERLLLELRGPEGAGKLGTAAAACRAFDMPLIAVDLERLAGRERNDWDRLFFVICREARLRDSALYWKSTELLSTDTGKALQSVLVRTLDDRPPLTFLSMEAVGEPVEALRDLVHVRLELSRPAAEQRARIWAAELGGYTVAVEDPEPAMLASKFRFTGGQIRNAARTAANLARWRNAEHATIRSRDLYEACRLHSNHKLSALARKITPTYDWADLILPADRLEQLREICNYLKYRSRVYGDWGFGRKLAMGKGLSMLFAGPSGTGKTMAADIIAGELGLDLYKVDLSNVVSKYIGETEKNLSRIFSEAETSNAILFFDEADALFGKRSEVKDAHDRYANIETGYLLQRMEEHEGIVILASNFRKNMDEAFVRRLQFSVDFPFPDEEDRRRIWEGVWPEAVPRDSGLDVLFLAKRFQITGGNIRNIALSAAFMAADEDGVVNMPHLIRAIQREYQKMGKVMTEVEFRKSPGSSKLG